MTGSNSHEKIRAIILAVLMIGSVFGATVAFTGGATADANTWTPVSADDIPNNDADFDQNLTVKLGLDANDNETVVLDTSNMPDGVTIKQPTGNNTTITAESSDFNVTEVDYNSSTEKFSANVANENGTSSVTSNVTFTLTVDATGAQAQSVSMTVTAQDAGFDGDFSFDITDATTGSVAESTSDVTDANAEINVSFTDETSVDENTINVTVYNNQTGETYSLVDNGGVTMGSTLDSANFTDGTNSDTEYVNLSVALPEGDYQINASANDTSDNQISGNNIGDGFTVNMAGDALKVVPDSSNPLASANASVDVVAVDQNGNELIFNESDVNATVGTLAWSFDQPAAITITSTPGDNVRPTADYSGNSKAYNVTYDITASEAGDYTLTANDVGDDATLDSGSATQTFTAAINSVDVSADSDTLAADSTSTINVTLELRDAQGNAIPRGGEGVSWSVNNTQVTDVVYKNTSTNNQGQATIQLNASQAGQTIKVTGVQADGYSDSATFTTTPGNVDTGTSTFLFNGSNTDGQSETVDTTHNVSVQLQDNSQNPVPGMPVEFSANTSATFADTTVESGSNGWANTTVTLPEQTGTTQLNVSAGDFNASAINAASLNVTTTPAAFDQIQFENEDPVVPSGSSATVTVEAVDTYGNLNTSAQPTIELATSDQSVINVAGGESATDSNTGDGTATFTINANDTTGSVTLTANATSHANVSDIETSASIGTAQSANVWFAHDVSTSSNAQQTTTVYAQLLDGNGNPINIANEDITFALSGDSAELDQSGQNFVNSTNSTGVAQFQVNATSTTGDSTVSVFAENFTLASSSGTVTTTGPATKVAVQPESTSVDTNTSVNVTVYYADSQDRMVPKTTQLTVQSDLQGSFLDNDNSPRSTKTTPTLMQNSGASSTVTLNSTNAGTATVTAFGGGTSGSASVAFEGAEMGTLDVTIQPDTVTANESTDVTVTVTDNATGEAVQGATVAISDLGLSATTDANGTATLSVNASTAGDYPVSVSADGYTDTTATLTVTPEGAAVFPEPIPGTGADNPPQDTDDDGLYEDVDGNGDANFDDAVALAFANTDGLTSQQIAALDFDGDGDVDFDDAVELAFSV